ncbi:hypothetical protein CCACVL1_00897, partial [Corchorus capsularis]
LHYPRNKGREQNVKMTSTYQMIWQRVIARKPFLFPLVEITFLSESVSEMDRPSQLCCSFFPKIRGLGSTTDSEKVNPYSYVVP